MKQYEFALAGFICGAVLFGILGLALYIGV